MIPQAHQFEVASTTINSSSTLLWEKESSKQVRFFLIFSKRKESLVFLRSSQRCNILSHYNSVLKIYVQWRSGVTEWKRSKFFNVRLCGGHSRRQARRYSRRWGLSLRWGLSSAKRNSIGIVEESIIDFLSARFHCVSWITEPTELIVGADLALRAGWFRFIATSLSSNNIHISCC